MDIQLLLRGINLKVKIKYFYILLGFGIGIIFTSTVFILNPYIEYKDYSKEEIVEKAKELGMVFVKENIQVDSADIDEDVDVVIEKGDNLATAADKLFNCGIIKDKKEFIKYAEKKQYQYKLKAGTYKLKKGMSFSFILDKLSK